jgi:hypothetical protein
MLPQSTQKTPGTPVSDQKRRYQCGSQCARSGLRKPRFFGTGICRQTEAEKRLTYRLTGVTTKLSPREVVDVEKLAKKRGQQRGEPIRLLILDELARDAGQQTAGAELTEIVGLRLLLTNILKPLMTGQKITLRRDLGRGQEAKESSCSTLKSAKANRVVLFDRCSHEITRDRPAPTTSWDWSTLIGSKGMPNVTSLIMWPQGCDQRTNGFRIGGGCH